MSCRYLENVTSKQDNSKTILKCFEDVLCRLGWLRTHFNTVYKLTASNLTNFMNGLRIIMRLFHSSEIQLFQTICFKITWWQTNKDYKEKLVYVPCFLNFRFSTFHIFLFCYVFLEVLICTSNSKNVLFI